MAGSGAAAVVLATALAGVSSTSLVLMSPSLSFMFVWKDWYPSADQVKSYFSVASSTRKRYSPFLSVLYSCLTVWPLVASSLIVAPTMGFLVTASMTLPWMRASPRAKALAAAMSANRV